MNKKRASLILKTSFVFIIILTAINPIPFSSSLLISTTSLSSSGSILYTFEEPEPTPFVNLDSELELMYALPLTGWGADLALHYNDDMSNWETSNILSRLEYWADRGMTVSRIEFQFNDVVIRGGSTYSKAKFDELLGYFDAIGVKVIADLHNDGGGSNIDLASYVLTDGFVNNWLQFVTDYKDDDRIAAINIFNEPTDLSSYGTSNTQQIQIYADLIADIHVIDPDRVVLFPYWWLMWYNNINIWFDDLQASGVLNDPYVIYDVSHPYFCEYELWDEYMSPEQKADWIFDTQILPAIEFFGSADKVWIGETFGFWPLAELSPGHPPATWSLQSAFITRIINNCVENDVGFQLFACTSPSEKFYLHTNILENSNYQVES